METKSSKTDSENYLSSAHNLDGKRKELYLHNFVMNKMVFQEKDLQNQSTILIVLA